MNQNFAVIVLAAGATEHRQRPRQLLPYLGKTPIEHAARTALASGAREVIVVAGSDAPLLRDKLKNLPIRVVYNRDWEEGIASSIRCGIRTLSSDVECAVVALGDQAKITPGLLRDLAQKQFESDSTIVASSYDGVVGAPCAFSREVFSELLCLQGASGARELIRRAPFPIETIEFAEGNVDFDEASGFQWVPIAEVSESPRDTYRDPREARGPPTAKNNSSFAT